MNRRDIQGMYLSDEEIIAIEVYLKQSGYIGVKSFSTTVENTDLFYRVEFVKQGISATGYKEIPTHWVKSFIRERKINQIID
jgi:hypothetical protein